MNIFQLIYVSTPRSDLKISDVEKIVNDARKENEKLSISGFLCANSKFFIQCLEGDEKKVRDLSEKIFDDSRHNKIKVIGTQFVSSRSFGHWGMGVVLKMERHFEIIKRYSSSQNFDPYDMSFKEALDMLTEFSKFRS